MTVRPRFAVIRLFRGGLFGTPKTVTFTVEDAQRFLTELKPHHWDQGNTLWGASVEMLLKRSAHPIPIDASALDQLIAQMKSSRMLARAESLERQANGYLVQAQHAQESAVRMRAEAAALRAKYLEGARP